MSAREQRIAEARQAVHESLTLHSAPEAERIRGLIRELEAALTAPSDTCEILHTTTEEEDECEVRSLSGPDDALVEARSWARHGYEIGQRHCCWSDYGVAPAWLTEGWPTHFESCPSILSEGSVELAEPSEHFSEELLKKINKGRMG
jgi:hypothetical protein